MEIIKNIFLNMSVWVLPIILLIILLFSLAKKIDLYDTFIDGAKEGFDVGVKIIPYLVAIMVAIGMFRASGAVDIIGNSLKDVLDFIHFPVDLLPLAIVRSLSGSGALGIFSELAQQNGADSFITMTAAVMLGCSETTFYVLSVYFGAVGITKFRQALAVGIIADIIGIIAAVSISNLIFT